jgi:hypothetical protein
VNLLIARDGGKELSTRKLKELGGNAEKEAAAIYQEEVAALNAMDNAPSSDSDAILGGDAMNTNPKSSAPDPLASNEFLQSILPNDSQLLEVSPDGNCLFCCILDQLNYDEGARHKFMCHQITIHISRNGNAFKNFLLLQDDHEDISDLDSYIRKMKQDGTWGGHPEVYAAAWFYCVDITIYAQEYTSMGGYLIFKGDGPDANCNADCPMWFLLYHGNNHYNSIRTPGNPLRPIQYIANVKHYQANLQSALDNYHDNYAQLVYSSIIDNAPILPHKSGSIWEITCMIMSYVAAQLLEAGGEVMLEE